MSEKAIISLGDCTTPELMFPSLEAKGPAEVIRELCAALQKAGCVNDFLSLYHAALNHEMMGASVVTGSWAMPHGRVTYGARLSFAVANLSAPMRWLDGSEATMVFLFAVPDAESSEYLRLLSGLGRLANDDALSKRLSQARESSEMFEILQQVPLRQPRRAPAAV